MSILRVDALRTKAAAAITGSYTTVGALIAFNWRIFRVTNNTDGDLFISFDGTTNNLFVPKSSSVVYDLSTNSAPISQTDNFVVGINTQLYTKYNTAPTTGDLWIEGLYARGIA